MTEKKRGMSKQFATLPWSDISKEGAYVSQTGVLFRIPSAGIKEGHSPIIDVAGPLESETLTFISPNPFTPVEKLRFLSAEANIEPNF